MSKAIKITENNQHGEKPMSNNTEARLVRLEDNVQQIRVDIAKINTRLDTELPHLATKADLAELRTELKGDSAGLRTELKGDIADVRTEIVKSHKKMIIWLISLVVASGLFNSFVNNMFHTHTNMTATSMQNQNY